MRKSRRTFIRVLDGKRLLERPRHRWEDIGFERDGMGRYGFFWLRIGLNGHGTEPSGSIKVLQKILE
jgi:hypothetical protein